MQISRFYKILGALCYLLNSLAFRTIFFKHFRTDLKISSKRPPGLLKSNANPKTEDFFNLTMLVQKQNTKTFYTDPNFDKAGRRMLLTDEALLRALQDDNSVIVPICRGNNVVVPCRSAPALYKPVFLEKDQVVRLTQHGDALVCYLGEKDHKSYFLLESPGLTEEFKSNTTVTFESLRKLGDLMYSEEEAALLAYARGLAVWHLGNNYCPVCGSSTKLYKAGAGRACCQCRYKSYPRLDPAIITLVTFEANNQEYALLGKKKTWSQGMYSCLSGFAEIGESLEECLLREVREESDIQVDPITVTYFGSQPWPFPHALMVGFRAKACKRNLDANGLPIINFDKEELEDVKWFSKAFVTDRLLTGVQCPADFCIPRRASLANKIIRSWALR